MSVFDTPARLAVPVRTLAAALVLSVCIPALAQVKMGSADKEALVALLGEEKVSRLKLDQLSGNGHTLTLLRSPIASNGEASGGKDTLVANQTSLFFCNAYIETMTQVVLDEKPALLHVFHRNPSDRVQPSRSGLHYDWTHIVRAFKGQQITTADERAAAKESGIVAFQEAKVTSLDIQRVGYKKHRQLLTNCEKAAGRLKELPEERTQIKSREQQLYADLMLKLTQLESGTAGGGAANSPAKAGAAGTQR